MAHVNGTVRTRFVIRMARLVKTGARVEAVCLTEPADHASATTAADGRYVLLVGGDCRDALDVRGASPSSDAWPQVRVGTSRVDDVDLAIAPRLSSR